MDDTLRVNDTSTSMSFTKTIASGYDTGDSDSNEYVDHTGNPSELTYYMALFYCRGIQDRSLVNKLPAKLGK